MIRNGHALASGLLGLVLLAAPMAQAYITQPTQRVVTTKQIPFTSLVYVGNTTAPEWVLFSGNLIVASDVKAPTGTCTPGSPCSLPAGVLALTTGITGVGCNSGLAYQLAGLSLAFDCNLQVPGPFSFQREFLVILPRSIKPVGRLFVTVPVTFVISFDASAKMLEAAVPPLGLVSWWQAEGTGLDAVGGNNGTLTETVSFVPGKTGQAFHFENQGLVVVPDKSSLEPTTVTVAAWVRGNYPQKAFNYVLSKGAWECAFSSYALQVPASGGLDFYVSDGLNYFASPDAGTGVWDGQWHFVVGSFDGKAVHLYVDGGEVNPGGTPAPISISYNASDNNDFYIGGFHDSCQQRFLGDIDEVQVYGRALLGTEVMGLYSAEK